MKQFSKLSRFVYPAFFILSLSCSKFPISKSQSHSIYGIDNRLSLNDAPSQWKSLARSTAVMIPAQNVVRGGRITNIFGNTLRMSIGPLCESERFGTEMAAGYCSGFLVAPDIVVTAAHCVESDLTCPNDTWVFDYFPQSPTDTLTVVPSENVYACKKVLTRFYDRIAGADFAVVQLERKVEGREPLALRNGGEPAVGEPLTLIGNPMGVSTKVITGEGSNVIFSDISRPNFLTNLDAQDGTSGAAVFNTKTGLVEGILVWGQDDVIFDEEKQCYKTLVCPETGCPNSDNPSSPIGETVMRITDVAPYLPGHGPLLNADVSTTTYLLNTKSATIPDNNADGLGFQFVVDSDAQFVNLGFEIKLEHKIPSDVWVKIRSPFGEEFLRQLRGTESEQVFAEGMRGGLLFGVHKLWNRSVRGVWEFRVADLAQDDEGILKSATVYMDLAGLGHDALCRDLPFRDLAVEGSSFRLTHGSPANLERYRAELHADLGATRPEGYRHVFVVRHTAADTSKLAFNIDETGALTGIRYDISWNPDLVVPFRARWECDAWRGTFEYANGETEILRIGY